MNKWLKLFLVIFTFALISIGIFVVLNFFKITDINSLRTIISKSGKLSYIIYTLVLATMLVVLCFVPLLNTTLAVLGIAMFGAKIAFITNMVAVFISTTALFFIGDKLGEKFASKLIGKKDLEETQNKFDHKSKFWLPILFITPGIPDEAICLVAGMTKIKYWYLTTISLIYHAFEIGLFCFFGSGLISWSSLSLFDWMIFVNIIAIDLYLLIKFEKYLENKTKNNKNN